MAGNRYDLHQLIRPDASILPLAEEPLPVDVVVGRKAGASVADEAERIVKTSACHNDLGNTPVC